MICGAKLRRIPRQATSSYEKDHFSNKKVRVLGYIEHNCGGTIVLSKMRGLHMHEDLPKASDEDLLKSMYGRKLCLIKPLIVLHVTSSLALFRRCSPFCRIPTSPNSHLVEFPSHCLIFSPKIIIIFFRGGSRNWRKGCGTYG